MIKQRTNQDRYIDMALLIVIFMCGLISGSYLLVQEYKTLQYFRCKEDIPFGFNKIDKYAGLSVYDKDGFLLSQFWSLPRI